MKQVMGWWWPDHEVHLIKWLEDNGTVVLNGRKAYQGGKQVRVLKECRSFHTAVDVGAHVGLWSYNLAERFQTVHAFEPVDEHRECFHRNVTSGEVLLHDCALGAAPGRTSIAVAHGSSGDSRMTPGDTVEVKTLDSLGIRNVDLIKCDAEGYEEPIMRGAEQTILEWKPTIIVEQKRDFPVQFGYQPLGAVEFLKGLGYRVVIELGGDFILVPA